MAACTIWRSHITPQRKSRASPTLKCLDLHILPVNQYYLHLYWYTESYDNEALPAGAHVRDVLPNFTDPSENFSFLSNPASASVDLTDVEFQCLMEKSCHFLRLSITSVKPPVRISVAETIINPASRRLPSLQHLPQPRLPPRV